MQDMLSAVATTVGREVHVFVNQAAVPLSDDGPSASLRTGEPFANVFLSSFCIALSTTAECAVVHVWDGADDDGVTRRSMKSGTV